MGTLVETLLSMAIILVIIFIGVAKVRRVGYQEQWFELLAFMNMGPNRI